ncbi:DUF3732 domain-containing protein [Nocardioides sp. Arc9.136]|uniref:DUF3732 domain-containing protein n=1 Tax=Nocardioides sp. Arc9.136 TaxID=2996826 RepID=UPI002665AF1A|nr:DUF3732 domain-containing protein [Nocardioides sp. Arc9.136]WKN46679.1 DUF3732 domain-containing protein [Nocardioides sp. Arc9.136]
MQLVSLALYSRNGEREVIPFQLGRLNVITGQSKTGKTVLVKLIDYCLGRSDVPASAGGVERALGWVGALWQFADGGRAFVGRPIPAGSAAENTEVMLVIGDGHLTPVDPGALAPNTNTRTMRLELGSRIGITESQIDPPAGAVREPLRTHLGHAALLCVQNQDEISNSMRLFHRSGQRGIDEALRDTIPYFLGAVPPDQALLKATLRQETRRLQRLERDLREADSASKEIDEDLRSLLTEAVEAGLAEQPDPGEGLTRPELISRLHQAARGQVTAPGESVTRQQDSRRRDQAELAIAEDELDQLMQQRSLLLEETEGGSAYADALDVQLGRLTSLNLLPLDSEQEGAGAEASEVCPVCGSSQANPDPSSAQMRAALDQLSDRLRNVRTASPAKSAALDRLNWRIEEAQARVRQARSVLEASFGADATVGRAAIRRQDFTRGRIDAILARAPEADDTHRDALRERITLAEQAVAELTLQLSDDTARERLNSRLLAVGRDLTAYARRLELEHSEQDVRIDLARLTVIADVDDNPVPLHRIGSAENWIGYHIAGHLALHQTFIRHERPVPRLLVIDQPSQGHYPSEVAKRSGRADTDVDELAVRRLYELMNEFTEQNPGQFQIIAVDHADIDRDWFQNAVVDNWRGQGKALIPAAWLPAQR